MKTNEIPKNEWPKFFDNFSSKHQGWSVTLEIFGTELGAQVQERELALVGIVDERDEIHGNRIVIMFGEKPDDHMTHSIGHATEVSLEQTEGGVGLRKHVVLDQIARAIPCLPPHPDAVLVHRGNPVGRDIIHDALPVQDSQRIGHHHQRVRTRAVHR